jgi:hypothetical protein
LQRDGADAYVDTDRDIHAESDEDRYPDERADRDARGDAELREAALAFTERLATGEHEAAREVFAPAVAEQVSAAALEGIWADLQRANGAYVSIEGAERTTVQSFAAVVVSVQFARARQGLRLVFDDDGRAVGFQIVAPVDSAWTPPEYVD